MRDSRNTRGLECGLNCYSLCKVGCICFGWFGHCTTVGFSNSKWTFPQRYTQNLSSTIHVAVFWNARLTKHLWAGVWVKLSKSLKNVLLFFGPDTVKECVPKWNLHASINLCSTRQKQRFAMFSYVVGHWFYLGKTNFIAVPKPEKIKHTFHRLWGFTLDMLEVDGGLRTQSRPKVGFICFLGSDISKYLVFPTKDSHLQVHTYKAIVSLNKKTVSCDAGLITHLWVGVRARLSKSLEVGVACLFWFVHCKHVDFASTNQHLQGETYNTLVLLCM